MSFGLKSTVRALSTGKKTVMRPLPAIQNCHSEEFGCQCSSRTPPGLSVTKAAASLERGKLRESTMRTSPNLADLVGAIDFSLKVFWVDEATALPPISSLSCATVLVGTVPGKI